MSDTPFFYLETLFPSLLEGARYAQTIQHRIHAVEDKEGAANIFAAALSDADLSVQNHIEVALLGSFPEVPFFGEEWKSSRNTKYLAGTFFVEGCPYLITLDPIDGTRPYLDGHRYYQVILTVISRDSFEAAISLFPAFDEYVYAVKGKGAFKGSFTTPLREASPLKMGTTPSAVFIPEQYKEGKKELLSSFSQVFSSAEYRKGSELLSFSAFLKEELAGGVIHTSQVIDGAALAFIAHEMGYVVTTFDGKTIPRPEEYPELILPGLLVGSSPEVIEKLRTMVRNTLQVEKEKLG